MCPVVVFKENSIFQKAGNLWYYVEADGDVAYEGDSMADAFDSPERQAAIAQGYADREKNRANKSSSSSSSNKSSTEGSAKPPAPPPPATAPAAKAAEIEQAAPPPPAAKKEAEPGSADEMDKLRSALMDM